MTDAPPPEVDLSTLSASLQSDTRDATVFFRVLCATLEDALPANTVVERDRGLLKKNRLARRVTVRLGDETFTAELTQGGTLCRHVHAVHGVGGGLPYSKDVTMPEWLAALLVSVAQDAQTTAATTAALRALIT